jgi:hypothetical protein
MTHEKSGLSIVLVVLALSVPSNAAVATAPAEASVLPGSEAAKVLAQCSRPAPEKIDGTWDPSSVEISDLEGRLANIEELESVMCCSPGSKLHGIHAYLRQYVGIVVGGHKLIYVNAFKQASAPPNWRSKAVNFCDGGTDFWGVVFDPSTGEFTQLAFNGVA